ncbi:MAG: ribbon-helix-helix protein, CopG family [Candidatus Nezhaarchaeales archaeon]
MPKKWISVRLDEELLDRIEELRSEMGLTRTSMIELLLSLGFRVAVEVRNKCEELAVLISILMRYGDINELLNLPDNTENQ